MLEECSKKITQKNFRTVTSEEVLSRHTVDYTVNHLHKVLREELRPKDFPLKLGFVLMQMNMSDSIVLNVVALNAIRGEGLCAQNIKLAFILIAGMSSMGEDNFRKLSLFLFFGSISVS